MSTVFLIPFHVTPTEKPLMPVGSAGAYVCCFAGESDLESAIGKALATLRKDGLSAEKILEPIEKMDSSQWTLHVNVNWPKHACSLHTQEEFEAAIDDGETVYGPFGVYNPY